MNKSGMKIVCSDCVSELYRTGLTGLLSRARSFIFDPRRKLIRKELATWPQRAEVRKPLPSNLKAGLVSVIMPVYDRTAELRESIESILCQTYDAFELILVTDGSPQETMKVVEGYLGEPRVRIIRFKEPSGTAVRGRNAGIAAARGEFIAFQDSDDLADPTRLAESVAQLAESGADIFYGGWRVRLEAKRGDVYFRDGDTILPPLFSVKDLFRNNRVCHGTVTARKSMFLAIGGYKPVMRFREDHELWLRAAYFGYRFVPYAKVMTTIRINNKNNTLNFIGNDPEWYNLMLREYRNAGPPITPAEALS